MRHVVGLSLLLLLAGMGACHVEFAATEPPQTTLAQPAVENDWRQTRDGWQHTADWHRREAYTPPPVHPLVVGGFQLLVSVTALLALPARAARLEG